MHRGVRYFCASLILVCAIHAPAIADQVVEEDVQGWRLQNYVPGTVLVYFTSSPCVSGMLSFPTSATSDDKNRFWSLVLTAKATGKKVGVYYETVSGSCQITSYYTAT